MNDDKKLLGPSVDMGKPGWLGEIAQIDPRLAYSLVGGPAALEKSKESQLGVGSQGIIRPDLLGWGKASCGWGWEIINLSAQFEDTAANQVIPAKQSGIVEQDLWIREVKYTVARPNAFQGNILKGESDHYNKLNPNIKFSLIVNSWCRYLISPDFTPLENIEQVFECVCPIGFVLSCNSQMTAQFTNCRALFDTSETNSEIPTEVTISFHAIRLPTRYDACAVDAAAAALVEMGILKAE